MISPSYRKGNVSNLDPVRVNCQTRAAAPRARCMNFFPEKIRNPARKVLSNNSHTIPHTPYEYYMSERYRTKPSVKKNNRTRNQTSSTGYAVPRLTCGHIKTNQKSLSGGSSAVTTPVCSNYISPKNNGCTPTDFYRSW